MERNELKPNAMSLLDVIVAASLVLIMLLSTVASFIRDSGALHRWLDDHQMILYVAGVAECALLSLWMCLGGQRSILWSWLPPFCFFPRDLWVRWVIVA